MRIGRIFRLLLADEYDRCRYMWVSIFLDCMLVITIMLELWTGIAIAGWAENSMVSREHKPRHYWFVMSFQIVALIAVHAYFVLVLWK